MEAYTAHVSTETSFMSEFDSGTVHDMQGRYYNRGKNRTPMVALRPWRPDFSSRPFPAPKIDN